MVTATAHSDDTNDYSVVSSSLTARWTTNTSDNSREAGLLVGSGNGTTLPLSSPEVVVVWPSALKSVIFGLIIVGTVLGNLLVCAAIGLTRKLRTASNLLIVSLAVSDLLVGTIDMPFALVYDVMGRWVLGQATCDLWTSVDVLVCTASILNLCMISIDRYLTVTKPFVYATAVKRAPARIFVMIGLVWVLSTVISVPPLFGWKAPETVPDQCEVSQDKGYQFFATIGAFYLPLVIMVVVYTRLYRVSSRLSKTEYVATARNSSLTPNSESVIVAFQQLQLGGDANDERGGGAATRNSGSPATQFPFPLMFPTAPGSQAQTPQSRQSRSHSLADALLKMNVRLQRNNVRVRSHDRKATRTLGVIMGAFIACWLPFFALAVTKPFVSYPSTAWFQWLNSLFLWLGYTNSLLNPIIYARFNRDFRTPFKCILQCRCANINSRLRSEDFAEQFGRLQVGRSVPNCLIPTAVPFHDDSPQARSAPILSSTATPTGSASAFASATAAAAAAAAAVAGGRRAMSCPLACDHASGGSVEEPGVTRFVAAVPPGIGTELKAADADAAADEGEDEGLLNRDERTSKRQMQ